MGWIDQDKLYCVPGRTPGTKSPSVPHWMESLLSLPGRGDKLLPTSWYLHLLLLT